MGIREGAMVKSAKPPKGGTFMGIKGVQLNEVMFDFTQDTDTDQSSDDICQTLTVRTPNCGEGAYLVIETERWAIDDDDIDKFADCLKRIVSIPEV